MTPTQRTLELLKEKYIISGIVERFIHNRNPQLHGIRSDLFHIFDIISLSENHIIGIQSCGTDFAAHYRKITEEFAENAALWLQAGGKIELIGWRKIRKRRGSKQMVTAPRIKEITLDDLKDAKAGDSKAEERKTAA